MKNLNKPLFLWLIVMLLLVVSGGANAQTNAPGVDVIFIMEGSDRYSDPANVRFGMVSAAADILSTNALYINPGEQNTLTLITHTDDSSATRLDAHTFGSYQQIENLQFSDPTSISSRQADVDTIVTQLADSRTSMSVNLGGADGGGLGYERAFSSLGSLLNQMGHSGRQQVIFVVFPSRPHLINLSAEFFSKLGAISSSIGDTPIHGLVFPINSIETNPSLRNILPSADWTSGLSSYNLNGTLHNVTDNPSQSLNIVHDLIGSALENVPSSRAEYIARIDLNNRQSLEMPPFVASAMLVGFNNNFVTPPSGAPTIDFERYNQLNIGVIENPRAGTYTLQGVTDATLWVRFGTPQLEDLSAQQLRNETLRYQVNDAFGRPLTSFAEGIGVNATLTRTDVNETSLTFAFSSSANRIGLWEGLFIPPYAGIYRLNLAVNVPQNERALTIPAALLNPNPVTLTAQNITVDLSSIPSQQPILRNTEVIVPTIPDTLTNGVLSTLGAMLCADFSSPSMTSPRSIALNNNGSAYQLSSTFAPTFAEVHTVTISLKRTSCAGESIVEIGRKEFTAQPIFIDFVDATDSQELQPFAPRLTQFLPSANTLGFFTLNNGTPSLITEALDIAPRVTFNGQNVSASNNGLYSVTIPAPIMGETTDYPLSATYTNINNEQGHIGFTQNQINATEPEQRIALLVTLTQLTVSFAGEVESRNTQPRQFDNANIEVSIDSRVGDQHYDSSALNSESGSIVTMLSYDGDSVEVPLTFNSIQGVFEASVSLPIGTTYTLTPHVRLNSRDVRVGTGSEIATLSVTPLTLAFVQSPAPNTRLYEEDSATYELGWFAPNDSAPVTERFSNEPTVTFDSTRLSRESDGRYRLEWTAQQVPNDQLTANWSIPLINAAEVFNSTSQPLQVNVSTITATYLQITCGDAGNECPRTARADDIEITQLWSNLAVVWRRTLIGVSQTPQIRMGMVLRAEGADGTALSGDDTTVSFEDVFGTNNPAELFNIEVRDASGAAIPDELIRVSGEGTTVPGAFWLTLSDIPENYPVTINVSLKDLSTSRGYVLRRAVAPAYTAVLTQDQVSTTLLGAAFFLTIGISILIAGAIRLMRYSRERQHPHFAPDSYVQFVTQEGRALGWGVNISSHPVNIRHYLSDQRWKSAEVTGMQIKTTDDPNEIMLRVWRTLDVTASFWDKLIYRLRGLSMFLRVPPTREFPIQRDTPVKLFHDKAVYYVLFSSVPTANTTQLRGRARAAALNNTQASAAQTPASQASASQTPAAQAPAVSMDEALTEIGNSDDSLFTITDSLSLDVESDPIAPSIGIDDSLPINSWLDSKPLQDGTSSRPRRDFDEDLFSESED